VDHSHVSLLEQGPDDGRHRRRGVTPAWDALTTWR
jgi:hypothetical protein